MDMQTMVGQKVMAGFPGYEMSEEFIHLVKRYKVGNVILFRRNVKDRQQLKELCHSIQELVIQETGQTAFIAIDQEGGPVSRLPGDSIIAPSAMAVSATNNPENARLAAEITAQELLDIGVNFNLAPVLDILSNADNPSVGVRSYGDTAETVSQYGCAALKGYIDSGIMASIKHFPGHGDTAVDSHVGLPVIDKSWQELDALDLQPFRAAIAAGAPSVMSTHILFPQLEPEDVPATMSRRIITGILKEKLGFWGLVLSDCLEMDAIGKYYGTTRGAVAAMYAGIDIVLISHTAPLAAEAIEAVYEAVSNGKLLIDEIAASAANIAQFKNNLCHGMREVKHEKAEAEQLMLQIRREAITLKQGEIFPLGSAPLFCGCRDYRVSQVGNAEGENFSFAEFMSEKFGGNGIVTAKNPDNEEIENVLAAEQNSSAVIFGAYNARLQNGQMALLNKLAALGKPMAVVAMGSPYDLAGLDHKITGIAAWEYSKATMEIIAEIFEGRYLPTGKMPVSI